MEKEEEPEQKELRRKRGEEYKSNVNFEEKEEQGEEKEGPVQKERRNRSEGKNKTTMKGEMCDREDRYDKKGNDRRMKRMNLKMM